MKYIYKIIGGFNENNFKKIIDKLSDKFICFYVDQVLFIALKSVKESEGAYELIKKTCKPSREFYIEEITEKNIMGLHPTIKDWCLKHFVRLDTEKYENENQVKLKEIWGFLDKMETELSKKKSETQRVIQSNQ